MSDREIATLSPRARLRPGWAGLVGRSPDHRIRNGWDRLPRVVFSMFHPIAEDIGPPA